MVSATDLSDPTVMRPQSASRLLDVRGLSLSFATIEGELPITKNVSFSIRPGERVGIVGESGCGKTVTGLSLLRLLPPQSARVKGEILFEGTDLAGLSQRQMRAVGVDLFLDIHG
ncbi:MAG: ATP-binding cassette domain-containing protein, partial [Afipia birgiae]|nr:ATP-binding cassette domain-containing protein [Afipia birgiae]